MWETVVGAKPAAIIWSNFLDKASTLVVTSKEWLTPKIVSLLWFLDAGALRPDDEWCKEFSAKIL
jgi:hypothetical protein